MENIKNTNSRSLVFDDLKAGSSWKDSVKITSEMVRSFIDMTKDRALVHVDSDHAKKMGFDRCVVHGFLVGCGYSRILGMFLPGSNTVVHKAQLDMLLPVYVDDVIAYEVCVDKIITAVKAVQLRLSAVNQDGKVVNKGTAMCIFRA